MNKSAKSRRETSPGERSPLSIGPDNWPAIVTDKIVNAVDAVRRQTTDRIVFLVRAAVYFLVASVVTIAVLALLIVAAVRLADAYLPIGAGVGSATWAAHGFIGLLITVIGFGAWRSRSGSTKPIYIALIINVAFMVVIVCYGIIQALR